MEIQSTKIVTHPSISYWGGCFSEGGFFVFLEVKEWENTSAADAGPQVLDDILTSFTNFPTRDEITVSQLIKDISEKKEISSAIVGTIDADMLHVGGVGDVHVYMKRDGSVGKILTGNHISSGSVQTNDVLLFSSSTVSKLFEEQVLKDAFLNKSSEDFESFIRSSLETGEGESHVAALLIECRDLDAQKIVKPKFTQPFSGKKIGDWIRKIVETGKKFPFKSLTDTSSVNRPKRMLLGVSVVLVILLFISIFFNINKTKDVNKQKQLEEAISLITHQYEEAVSLIDLNPVRARTLLSDSKLTLTPQLAAFTKKSDEYKTILEWLQKISDAEVAAYKIYKLTSAPLFFDITLVKKEGEATKFALYENNLAILDSKNDVVYALNTKTKEANILAGSEIVNEAGDITIHGKRAFIINTDGVESIDISTKTTRKVISKDEKWGNIAAITAYGGNVYMLDTDKHAVWKYIATETGFLTRQNYLVSGGVDFSGGIDLVIDGSVWVLIPDSILKFTKGITDSFDISGFADTLTGLGALFVSDATKYMYVLDKHQSRIVVFDKDGVYQAQYQWDEFKNATDLATDEESKKIFVASGSKIYGIDIK